IEDGRFDLALGAAPPSRVALTQLALDGSLAIDPSGVYVDLATLHAVPRGVAVSPLSARGDVTVAASGDAIRVEDVTIRAQRSRRQGGGRIGSDHLGDFELAATPLSIRELRAMVPAVPIRPDLDGMVVARGPWHRIALRTALRAPSAGAMRLFGIVDAAGNGLPYAARARVRHLDLAAVEASLPRSDLTGHVAGRGAITTLDTPLDVRLRLAPSRLEGADVDQARLTGRIVSEALDARGVVVARAGRADMDGHLSCSREPSYHARARLQVVDLSALLPTVPGSGRLRATVEGRGFTGPGRSVALRADVDGARLFTAPVDGGSATL